MPHASFDELTRRANELDGLSSTSSTKYDAFKDWLEQEYGAAPAVCFLSELGRQWTSRVGQALMGMPRLLVLLVHGDWTDEASERLSLLHEYVTGLEASVVLTGAEGAWTVAFTAGRPGSPLRDALPDTTLISSTGEPHDTAGEGSEPRRRRVDFVSLPPYEQAELVWGHLIGRGPLDLDEAIREAAYGLREDGVLSFQRLRRDGSVYAAIEQCISFSTRRGVAFDRPARGQVRAVLRDANGFAREHWRTCVDQALGEGNDWVERDALVRASADWAVHLYGLDMQKFRTGGRVDGGIRSAINGMIRLGRMERHGASMLRRTYAERPEPVPTDSGSVAPPGDPVPSPLGHDVPAVPESALVSPSRPAPVSLPDTPSYEPLRDLLGALPLEIEPALSRLLSVGLRAPSQLEDQVDAYLEEFERAFEIHQFLDLTEAERLAEDSRRLVRAWPDLSIDERHLAQAAILYFVESDEADDDYRLNGLKTDRVLMDAVKRVVLPEPTAA